MSAAALMDWLGQHLPMEQQAARNCGNREQFHHHMASLTGVVEPMWMFFTHDELCARYLQTLQTKYLMPISTKPGPVIPPPVWDSRPVTATTAMAAVRALCGDSRG